MQLIHQWCDTANVNSGLKQHWVVGGRESVKAIGMGFSRAVASEQLVIEKQRNFVDRIVCREIQRVKQVGLPVGAQFG